MPLALKPQKRISEIDFQQVSLIAQELECDKLFAQILYNRGFDTVEKCKDFLYPTNTSMLDPFSMKNMDKLIDYLNNAKKQNKTVTVYGDYDVDGICASYILKEGLNALDDTEYVMIHDGARPLLTQEIISDSLECVKKENACVVGMPVKDTIKISDDNEYAINTPDRKYLWMNLINSY